MAEVRLQESESLGVALRSFKREVRRQDVIQDAELPSFYLMPGDKKRIQEALARNRKKERKKQD